MRVIPPISPVDLFLMASVTIGSIVLTLAPLPRKPKSEAPVNAEPQPELNARDQLIRAYRRKWGSPEDMS